MRVALLSYQHAYNYGAVFQIAALQHVIQTLGHQCDIVDYRCGGIESQYRLRKVKMNSKILKTIRSNLVLYPFIKEKKRNFEHWFMQNAITNTIYEREELGKLNSEYDKFIVGSDQVWNLQCNGYDDSFLLDFVIDNNKKISYAASFGKHVIPASWEPHFSKYLPLFASISVREERGSEIVAKYCNITAPCTMDPVLLVGREYWKKRMSTCGVHEPYVFVYHLGHDSLIPKYLKLIRKRYKNIIYVTGHSGNIIHYSLTDKNRSTASPEDFLSLLYNSEYVVTNSFHATVLSLLFNKPLSVVTDGGEKATYNTRIFSLLKRYGKLECLVSPPFDKIPETCYYGLGDNIDVEYDRQFSIQFLTESLEK